MPDIWNMMDIPNKVNPNINLRWLPLKNSVKNKTKEYGKSQKF